MIFFLARWVLYNVIAGLVHANETPTPHLADRAVEVRPNAVAHPLGSASNYKQDLLRRSDSEMRDSPDSFAAPSPSPHGFGPAPNGDERALLAKRDQAAYWETTSSTTTNQDQQERSPPSPASPAPTTTTKEGDTTPALSAYLIYSSTTTSAPQADEESTASRSKATSMIQRHRQTSHEEDDMSLEEEASPTKIFQSKDVDESGYLETSEIGSFLEEAGVDPTFQLSFFDKDGDGKLSEQEFIQAWERAFH